MPHVILCFVRHDGIWWPITYRRFLWLSIRILTGFHLTHVLVGAGDVVLDPRLDGNRFWPMIPCLQRFPHLSVVFRIPVCSEPDWTRFEEGVYRKMEAWRTFLSWLTRGRVVSDNCVSMARSCLAEGGIDTPDWITTPRDLYRWCVFRGFEHENAD